MQPKSTEVQSYKYTLMAWAFKCMYVNIHNGIYQTMDKNIQIEHFSDWIINLAHNRHWKQGLETCNARGIL